MQKLEGQETEVLIVPRLLSAHFSGKNGNGHGQGYIAGGSVVKLSQVDTLVAAHSQLALQHRAVGIVGLASDLTLGIVLQHALTATASQVRVESRIIE